MGTSTSEYERLGAKRLSLPDVIAQSVGRARDSARSRLADLKPNSPV
jgi:hypothetical protein